MRSALIILLVAGILPPAGGYTVLFTQNHGEGYDIWGKDLTGFLKFSRLLEDEGFAVEALNRGTLTPEVLEGVDVVVVSYPEVDFSSGEIETLKTYVAGGGSLAVFGGMDTINQTNRILRIFALEITSNLLVVNGSTRFTLDVPEGTHPVFTHVRTYQQINTPTVRVLEGPADVFRYLDMEEDEGLIVVKKYGKGRILVTADADFLNNVFLYNYDNAQLGVNIISYMAGKLVEKIGASKEGNGYAGAAIAAVLALTFFLAGRYIFKRRMS